MINSKPWHSIFTQIDKKEFSARPLSWIYCTQEYVFKITRYSDSIEDDIFNPKSIKYSKKEYEQLLLLNQLDASVIKPLDLIDACMVMPYIKGHDLINESAKIRVQDNLVDFLAYIEEGIALCGRLHRYESVIFADIPEYNYQKHEFLPASEPHLIQAIKNHRKTISIQGFEIRNFRYDQLSGKLVFFDPHHVYLGLPEEDFTRYILSLLMINWGRNINFLIWQKFDYAKLVKVYETTRGAKLDKLMLDYTFSLNLAMRKAHAKTSILEMNGFKKLIAYIYFQLFFLQVDWWRKNMV